MASHAKEMNPEEQQVRRFYEVIWNRHDKSAIPDILQESFLFRGSLGDETEGYEGFAEYLDRVHEALADFKCIIKETVAEQSKLFARMQFTGIHRGRLLGVKPTGQRLTWEGAALFHFENGKIASLWVLGDLQSLELQLLEYSR